MGDEKEKETKNAASSRKGTSPHNTGGKPSQGGPSTPSSRSGQAEQGFCWCRAVHTFEFPRAGSNGVRANGGDLVKLPVSAVDSHAGAGLVEVVDATDWPDVAEDVFVVRK